jgi:hypothetical protein
MSKPEAIAPNGDNRYIRRNDEGCIKGSVAEEASLAADAWHQDMHHAGPAQCDQGAK